MFSQATPVFTRNGAKVTTYALVDETGLPNTMGKFRSTKYTGSVQGWVGVSTGVVLNGYLLCLKLNSAQSENGQTYLATTPEWVAIGQLTTEGVINKTVTEFQRYYRENRDSILPWGSGDGDGFSPGGFDWNLGLGKYARWILFGLGAAFLLSQAGKEEK